MCSTLRSPVLEAMYRRRPTFTRPPIRSVNSPPLTEEEADQLTSPFLTYTTGYTYAFSQAYNPDNPPTWEVPNISNNVLHITDPDYVPYRFSATNIVYKVGQKGMAAISTLITAPFWLLYLVLGTVALFLCIAFEFILWLIRTYRIFVSQCLYNVDIYYANRRSYSSRRGMLSFTLLKLLCGLLAILLAPVVFAITAFNKFRIALKRSYYALLKERGREIERRARLARLEERRCEYEARHFGERFHAQNFAHMRGEHVDYYGGGQFIKHDGYIPHYLRRHLILSDTDSDDDITRRTRNASSARFSHSDGRFQSHRSYRVATWPGSAASSFVYCMLCVVKLLGVYMKRSYDGVNATFAYFASSILSSSTALASKFIRSRAGRHEPLSREAHLGKRAVYFGMEASRPRRSPIVTQFKSLSFSILYTPCRAFLFAVFAGADLFRWMYSRHHRWLWCLLPVFLLLLFFYRGTTNQMIILGHDVSTLPEQVSNYAHSLVDSDEVYAESSNSIYDEYWHSGKWSGYNIISIITTAASNSYLFVVTVFRTPFDLIYTSVGGLLSLMLEFFASFGHESYSGLSTPHKAELNQNPSMSLVYKDTNPNAFVPSVPPSIDEAKLIDKISVVVRAKMDQDFKEKFEKELKALSATYDEKLSRLELDKSQISVDYARLESIIRTAILEYDSDKTGMFDFALESAGAAIISTRCSENYNTYSRLEKVWNIPLWYSSYGPRTVIQRNSKTLFPGECWSFKGPVGYITIGLSHAINVTLISYEHIGAHQAPDGERPSAPKTFKIWAYKSENDMNTRVLLGDFMYDLKGNPLQFFVVKTQPDYPVKIIEMEVTSNHGSEYTSLYRLRVHGSLYKSGNI